MQIIDEKPSVSKSAEIRNACEVICNQDKAVFVEYEKDCRYFTKVAKMSGYAVHTHCCEEGGYKIWLTK